MFGNLFQQLKDTQEHLKAIQTQLATSPTSTFLIIEEKDLNLTLKNLLEKEELFYAQKARANWLHFGDKDTKIFQTQAIIALGVIVSHELYFYSFLFFSH